MSLTRQRVVDALRAVSYPGFTRDVVSFGIVRDVEVEGGRVRVRLDLGAGNPAVSGQLEHDVRQALEALDGVASAEVEVVSAPARAGSPAPGSAGRLEGDPIPAVRHAIAVASGKGGVGKSTVAVNLAVALARGGLRVGLLDADIYGPSIPIMTGVDERPRLDGSGERLLPFERHGIRLMSLGFLVDRESAVIWRGPMVMKAVDQLLRDVEWGELEVLVVDLPPGTGDAQLTLSQSVRLSGAVIVTTPQDVALADAVKGVAMFRKVGVPILGIVENMSFFACPRCGERTDIFGHGGGSDRAARLGVPFLGAVPLDPALRDSGDRGIPLVLADPSSRPTKVFLDVAARIARELLPESSRDLDDEPRRDPSRPAPPTAE